MMRMRREGSTINDKRRGGNERRLDVSADVSLARTLASVPFASLSLPGAVLFSHGVSGVRIHDAGEEERTGEKRRKSTGPR